MKIVQKTCHKLYDTLAEYYEKHMLKYLSKYLSVLKEQSLEFGCYSS